MNLFISKLNIFTGLFVAVILVVFLYAFDGGVKYITYLTIATAFITFIIKVKTINLQLPVVLITIVFIHSVLVFENNINFFIIDAPILLVVVFLLVNKYAHDIKTPLDNNYQLFILIVIISAIVSIFFGLLEGVSIETQVDDFQRRVVWLVVYFIFGLQVASYSQWGRIEWLAIVALLLGIMQFYALTTGANIEAVRDDVVVSAVRDVEKNWRYGGVFGNSNTLAAFIICCLPFSIRGSIESKNILLVIVYLLTIIISLFSVLTTGSRTGLLLFFPVFFASYLYISLQGNKEGYSVILNFFKIGISLLLVGVIYYLYPVDFDMQLIENTFERYDDKGTEEDIRFDLWKCTLENGVFFNPGGMGIGYEKFTQFVLEECDLGRHSLANPHNIFLEIVVSLGFIGAGLFIIMVFALFNTSQDRRDMRQTRSAEFIFILCFILYGMSEPLLFSAQKINWVFAIILGIFFSRYSPRTK